MPALLASSHDRLKKLKKNENPNPNKISNPMGLDLIYNNSNILPSNTDYLQLSGFSRTSAQITDPFYEKQILSFFKELPQENLDFLKNSEITISFQGNENYDKQVEIKKCFAKINFTGFTQIDVCDFIKLKQVYSNLYNFEFLEKPTNINSFVEKTNNVNQEFDEQMNILGGNIGSKVSQKALDTINLLVKISNDSSWAFEKLEFNKGEDVAQEENGNQSESTSCVIEIPILTKSLPNKIRLVLNWFELVKNKSRYPKLIQ
jgi:hypothetical protein